MSRATRLHDVQCFFQYGGVCPVCLGGPHQPTFAIEHLEGGGNGVLEGTVEVDVRHATGFHIDNIGGFGRQQERPRRVGGGVVGGVAFSYVVGGLKGWIAMNGNDVRGVGDVSRFNLFAQHGGPVVASTAPCRNPEHEYRAVKGCSEVMLGPVVHRSVEGRSRERHALGDR